MELYNESKDRGLKCNAIISIANSIIFKIGRPIAFFIETQNFEFAIIDNKMPLARRKERNDEETDLLKKTACLCDGWHLVIGRLHGPISYRAG